MTTVASALIVLALLPPVAAQDPVEEERLDPEQVRAARASVDTVLDEALRAQLVELFDAALGELEQIELDRLKIERFADQVEGVDDRIEELRGELENFENGERVGLADDVGPDEAHRELGLERERLAAHREALRTAEQRSEDRAATRTDVSRRLGELDQTVEAIEKELRGVRESDLGPELREAMQTHLQARGEAAKSRIGSLRAELAWIESRARLMPWEIDLAERGVTHSEQLVAALESRSRRLMRAESNTALERAIATCDEATALSPVLQPIAEELRSLAELRWGEGSVVALSDRTSAALLATRKHRDDLDRVIQLTRRLYVAYGRQGSIGRWWPQLPEGFPSSAEVERRILEVQIEVPEVQHHLIRFEQARSKSRALHEETLAALRAEGDRVDPRAEEVGFDLLNLRRDLLEELTAEAGRYTDQLVEYESSLVYLRDQMGRVETFLFERVLWSRSVPRPVIPSPKSIGEGFAWLFSADHLRALFGAIRRGVFRTDVVLWAIAVVALVLLRTRIRNRLHTLADQIANPDREVLLATLRAAVQTVLLAAPLPLALLAASHMFRGSTGVWVADAASRALLFTASIAALFGAFGRSRHLAGWDKRISDGTPVC